MYKLNNLKIDINRPFTGSDGTKYPHLLPQEYRDKLGVVEVPDPVLPNSETDTYIENVDGSITVTAIPLAQVKLNKLAQIRSQAQAIIYKKYPAWAQSNAALDIYPVAFADTMRDEIASVIVASNITQDAILAATTNEQVIIVEAIWPVL